MQASRRVIRWFALKTPDELLRSFCFLCIAAGSHHGVSMCLSRAMARFTTRSELRGRGLRRCVYGFLELLRFLLMAGRTSLGTHVIGRVRVRWRPPRDRCALRGSRLLLS